MDRCEVAEERERCFSAEERVRCLSAVAAEATGLEAARVDSGDSESIVGWRMRLLSRRRGHFSAQRMLMAGIQHIKRGAAICLCVDGAMSMAGAGRVCCERVNGRTLSSSGESSFVVCSSVGGRTTAKTGDH